MTKDTVFETEISNFYKLIYSIRVLIVNFSINLNGAPSVLFFSNDVRNLFSRETLTPRFYPEKTTTR